ncbi:MAG: hypothetical protein ABFD97_15560 [Syntrophobacter sp.]
MEKSKKGDVVFHCLIEVDRSSCRDPISAMVIPCCGQASADFGGFLQQI